jgi:hypothetical protein
MKNEWKRVKTSIWAVLLVSSALHGEEKCSVEIKLLLSPPAIQNVIASLSFKKEAAGQVFFFDTDGLDLQKQGVIVRVRQGASNDLTVKVRVLESSKQVDTSWVYAHFPCEINRTGAGEDTDYFVKRSYKTIRVPEMGKELSSLLTSEQKRLLQKARILIDWSRVRRIASINATSWESAPQSSFGKLALELWQWPTGTMLEVSSKVGTNERQSKYPELQRLVKSKNLVLNPDQGSKTSMVLETITHQPSSFR